MNKIPELLEEFKQLVEVIEALRDPVSGCPWDREQTHLSLKPYLIEEAYEALEAIDAAHSEETQAAATQSEPAQSDVSHWQGLQEELGDLLLQILLHAEIAKSSGNFGLQEIVTGLRVKLVERHPHVFDGSRQRRGHQELGV